MVVDLILLVMQYDGWERLLLHIERGIIYKFFCSLPTFFANQRALRTEKRRKEGSALLSPLSFLLPHIFHPMEQKGFSQKKSDDFKT